MQTESLIRASYLGELSYSDALDLQFKLHNRVNLDPHSAYILGLQHKKVITLGKNAKQDFIVSDFATLQNAGIERLLTDRGGEVTAHEPNQLVVYPILPLGAWRLGPKNYVDALMQAVILTLQKYGIQGHVDSRYPGVWVGSEKICAVGIRVKERISLHGIALNINNSLDIFQHIVPCGIQGRGVTSMQRLLGKGLALEAVLETWLTQFGTILQRPITLESAESLLSLSAES